MMTRLQENARPGRRSEVGTSVQANRELGTLVHLAAALHLVQAPNSPMEVFTFSSAAHRTQHVAVVQ